MAKRLFKSGQIFGEWRLTSFLGGGGNGEVWKVHSKTHGIAAIKLLKKIKSKAYARFIDEIKVIEENSDIKGITPIMDKYLPTKLDENEVPYFVMPVAENAITRLNGKSMTEKVKAILDLCVVLAVLHTRGISHRDIKPSNILFYNEQFCLVDFGLVDYPNKKDLSVKNEEIGAKWTMAPEMKRDSYNADGLKADIYSLAKTLWMFLAENYKGFDGQYSGESILELKRFYPAEYTTPIDNLLASSTDNDPGSRPVIREFGASLQKWIKLSKSFHETNQEQWFEIQTKLFPACFPETVTWEDADDIITVLNLVAHYKNLNHTFFPNGGGMDLEKADRAHEDGFIQLDFLSVHIVKPRRLVFHSFKNEPIWNYFRLELDTTEPSGVYIEHAEEVISNGYERLSELYPGHYEDFDIVSNRFYYELEAGYEIPEDARTLTRWLNGSFVIFSKRSIYNLINETYDGRHNKMNDLEFREYIKTLSDQWNHRHKIPFPYKVHRYDPPGSAIS